MSKKAMLVTVAVALVVVIGIYAVSRFSYDPARNFEEVSGSITYLERIALPENSLIEVRLQDVSRADAPADVLASSTIRTRGENVPIPFTLRYDPLKIDERSTYSVSAQILVDEELRWISTDHIPVITNGHAVSDIVITVSAAGAGSGADRSEEMNTIVNTAWTWLYTSLQNGSRTTAPAGDKFVLTFAEDQTVFSTTDCNSLRGQYAIDGESLSFSAFAATLMACSPDSREDEYSEALLRTVSYTMSGGELTLNLAEDAGTMVFARHVADSETEPNGNAALEGRKLAGTAFRLSSYDGTTIPAEQDYRLAFEDGSLNAKFCNSLRGAYTLGDDAVLRATLVGTKMACLNPENLMEIEAAFGLLLSDGAEFSWEENTLTLSGNQGKELVFTQLTR